MTALDVDDGAGIPVPGVPSDRTRFAEIEVRDGGRLLGIIKHEGARVLAIGPRGARLGAFASEASARRMIVACAGFRILDKDAEKRRREELRKRPWKRRA